MIDSLVSLWYSTRTDHSIVHLWFCRTISFVRVDCKTDYYVGV